MQTLKTVIQSVEFAKAKGIKVRFHDRQKNEPAHYCGQCDVSTVEIRTDLFLIVIGLCY